MIYAEHVENNAHALRNQVRHTQYDYEDSLNTQRELQARIKDLEDQLRFLSQDNSNLKHINPYVLVLVDGNDLIVR